jgi:hypothetical protein
VPRPARTRARESPLREVATSTFEAPSPSPPRTPRPALTPGKRQDGAAYEHDGSEYRRGRRKRRSCRRQLDTAFRPTGHRGMRNFGRRVSVAPASWPPAAPRRPREGVPLARRAGVRGRWARAGPTRGDVPARGLALVVVGRGAEGATARVPSRCAMTCVPRARGCVDVGGASGPRPPTVAAGFGSGFSGSPAYATRAPVLATTTAISATNSFRAGTPARPPSRMFVVNATKRCQRVQPRAGNRRARTRSPSFSNV